MNLFALKARPSRGFTLVEILIVISIIGILAAAVLVGLGPIQRRGRDTRRISDLRQVEHALALYYNRCGFYPGAANCASPPSGAAAIPWSNLTTALTGSSIGVNQIPNDPRGGSNSYLYGTDGSSYVLGALLEDNGTSILNDDIDGSAMGVNCGNGGAGTDTTYCIQF